MLRGKAHGLSTDRSPEATLLRRRERGRMVGILVEKETCPSPGWAEPVSTANRVQTTDHHPRFPPPPGAQADTPHPTALLKGRSRQQVGPHGASEGAGREDAWVTALRPAQGHFTSHFTLPLFLPSSSFLPSFSSLFPSFFLYP